MFLYPQAHLQHLGYQADPLRLQDRVVLLDQDLLDNRLCLVVHLVRDNLGGPVDLLALDVLCHPVYIFMLICSLFCLALKIYLMNLRLVDQEVLEVRLHLPAHLDQALPFDQFVRANRRDHQYHDHPCDLVDQEVRRNHLSPVTMKMTGITEINS